MRSIKEMDKRLDEREQEIEKLSNMIETFKDANEYHQNKIEELEKALRKSHSELYSENVKLSAENNRLNNIIKEVREYINSIDEIEVRYLDKEALYRNHITEYQIQEQLKKDKTLEGHFVKVNKYYLLEILDKGE